MTTASKGRGIRVFHLCRSTLDELENDRDAAIDKFNVLTSKYTALLSDYDALVDVQQRYKGVYATLRASHLNGRDYARGRRLMCFFANEFESNVTNAYQPMSSVKRLTRVGVQNKEKAKAKAERDYAYFNRKYKAEPFFPDVCYDFWIDMAMQLVVKDNPNVFSFCKKVPPGKAVSVTHIKFGALSDERREALLVKLFGRQ